MAYLTIVYQLTWLISERKKMKKEKSKRKSTRILSQSTKETQVRLLDLNLSFAFSFKHIQFARQNAKVILFLLNKFKKVFPYKLMHPIFILQKKKLRKKNKKRFHFSK